MTTEITVEIKGGETILDAARQVQANARADYERKKKEEKSKIAAKAAAQQQQEDEEDEYKGAILEEEEEDKPENRAKSKKCGFWIYKDWKLGNPDYDVDYPEDRLYGGQTFDTYQISVGTGDGTKWVTHYINTPGAKSPALGVRSTQEFVGYLYTMQFYTGAFGTVYTIPEDATVVPYDPTVYITGFPVPSDCPNGFCWSLYFPDELNSGPGVSRAMMTLGKKGTPAGNFDSYIANQAEFIFPINDKKSILIMPCWAGWSRPVSGESYTAVLPGEEYSSDPNDSTRPTITRKVYYKYPGGPETGWQPITGHYRLIDPSNSSSTMTLTRLKEVYPLLTGTTVHDRADTSEVVAFVVGPNAVKKLDSIPEEVYNKVKSRCPDPVWGTQSTDYWSEYMFRETNDNMPGYPEAIANWWNNASWSMNPDAHAMGVARNVFWGYAKFDSRYLPYDYWLRDAAYGYNYADDGYAAFTTHLLLGASPGIYDTYAEDLQDHKFYNHFGLGDWYENVTGPGGGGPAYSAGLSFASNFGDVCLHAPDITQGSWAALYDWWDYSPSLYSELATSFKLTDDDTAWMYLNQQEKTAFVENYFADQIPGRIPDGAKDYAKNAFPEPPEFRYVTYSQNEDEGRLTNGVRWISNGSYGSWTDANQPPFDYGDDPWYDPPFMSTTNILENGWRRYNLYQKLSKQRLWPPSISAGYSDPLDQDTSLEIKANHPLAKGKGELSMVMNTAWGNDYSQVLLAMGFSPADLAI